MPAIATNFLPYHRALIDEEEVSAVLETLRSGWLTTGPRVREFETEFARYVGAHHAVAFSSCTAALHLALAAIGLQEGDEVILPTMRLPGKSFCISKPGQCSWTAKREHFIWIPSSLRMRLRAALGPLSLCTMLAIRAIWRRFLG